MKFLKYLFYLVALAAIAVMVLTGQGVQSDTLLILYFLGWSLAILSLGLGLILNRLYEDAPDPIHTVRMARRDAAKDTDTA